MSSQRSGADESEIFFDALMSIDTDMAAEFAGSKDPWTDRMHDLSMVWLEMWREIERLFPERVAEFRGRLGPGPPDKPPMPPYVMKLFMGVH